MNLRTRLCVAFVALVFGPGIVLAQQADSLTLEPYIFKAQGEEIQAERGRLRVPENRAKQNGKTIELAFVRLPATTETPAAPIVYLAGGPGGSGIGTGKSPRFHLFNALRGVADVILLDQRGVGESVPNLACSTRLEIPLDEAPDWDRWVEYFRKASRECAQEWEAKGVDLSGYTTNESADDVDALREALGLEKISLWGTSYGTHLSFAVIRRHGAHLERVVVSGAEGPDHTLKMPSTIQRHLELVHDLIKNDPEVCKLIPDFLGLVEHALGELETPIVVSLGGSNAVTIGRLDLQIYTAEAVGRVSSIRNIPQMYYDIANRDYRRLARESMGYRRSPLPSAMSWVMDCASGVSAERLARLEEEAKTTLLGNAVNFPFLSVCDAWGSPDLGPEFRGELKSGVPILFISGTLDGRTPVSNAEELIPGFPNTQHLIVEGVGHEESLFSLTPGITEAMIAFYQNKPLPHTRLTAEPVEFSPVRPQ